MTLADGPESIRMGDMDAFRTTETTLFPTCHSGLSLVYPIHQQVGTPQSSRYERERVLDEPFLCAPDGTSGMERHQTIIALSGVFAVGAWFLEAALDAMFFYDATYLSLLLLDVPFHELYIRSLIGLTFILFGLIAARQAKQIETQSEDLALFRTLIDEATDSILVIDPTTGRFVDVNDRACERLAYERSALLGMSVADINDEFEDPAAFKAFMNSSEGETLRNYETTHTRADGTTVPVEVSASGVSIEGQEYRIAIARDITARKERERELERLHWITRIHRDINQDIARATTREGVDKAVCDRLVDEDAYRFVWIGDVDTETDAFAPRAAAGAGQNYLEEVSIPGDIADGEQGPIAQAVRTREPQVVNDIAADASFGRRREAALDRGFRSNIAVPLLTGAGDELYGVLNVYAERPEIFTEAEIRLLTELGKTIVQAIRALEQRDEALRFREAVEQAGHAMYITDIDGTIEYVNAAFEEVTQYSASEALGENVRLLKSGQQDQAFYEGLWETILDEEIWSGEVVDRRKSGELYVAQQTIAPIFDTNDDLSGFVAIQTDITDQRIREQQLDVFNRVLRHNLRNQVTVIGGNVDMLLERCLDEDARDQAEIEESLQRIKQTAVEMEALGEKAQQIARIGDRIQETERTVDLSAVLPRLESQLEAMAPDARVDVTQAVDDPAVDAGVEYALEEVVENAVKHNDAATPEVIISVSADSVTDTELVVSVADNGPGIPAPEREVLAEGEEKPLLHGSGLGLWLVHWVVSGIGGHISITDSEPRGSLVRLHLPRHETEATRTLSNAGETAPGEGSRDAGESR